MMNSNPSSSSSSSSSTGTGIPFIKSKGRTVPKPFNLSTSSKSSAKKRDISHVQGGSSDDLTSSATASASTAVSSSSTQSDPALLIEKNKKIKMIHGGGVSVGSGVPFIKKKASTICKPPVLSTDRIRKNEKAKKTSIATAATTTTLKSSVNDGPKTPYEIEEEMVEKFIRELFMEVFKKDVNADPERIKVSTDALIKRLNTKIEKELQWKYQFHTTTVDFALLKNFCRQHSRKFEIEMQSKLIKLKKPSVLKAVNSTNKPNKAVLIASIKKQVENQTSISTEKTEQEKEQLVTQDENKKDEILEANEVMSELIHEPAKDELQASPVTTTSQESDEKPEETTSIKQEVDNDDTISPQSIPQGAAKDKAQSVGPIEQN
nr:unnamed protein product [Naegleria fowleri]